MPGFLLVDTMEVSVEFHSSIMEKPRYFTYNKS